MTMSVRALITGVAAPLLALQRLARRPSGRGAGVKPMKCGLILQPSRCLPQPRQP
jgi:hypothetical protein